MIDAREGETVTRRRTSNRTINLELALLRRMFRLAARRRKVLVVPAFEMLKDAAPGPASSRRGSIARWPSGCPRISRRQWLSPTPSGGGCAPRCYRWSQLDLKAGTLRLDAGTTKNGEGRVVYLTPEVRALLAAQLERVEALQKKLGRIVPGLFPHLEGGHQGAPRRGFRKAWASACRAAGVPGRILHDFRRTAVRNMEQAGVPRSVAMKLTGHKTEAIYRRYAIVSDSDLQAAAQRLHTASRAQSVHS